MPTTLRLGRRAEARSGAENDSTGIDSTGIDSTGTNSWATPASLFVRPTVLTILGTYKCTAACDNCCFGSNPYLTKRLDLEDILGFIAEGAQYPECRLVVFSGGECFLLRDDLVRAVEYATSLGLATRCVTNGFWAKRIEHGRRRLTALKEAGLRELNVSTGDYHQQYVDQETVINAASLGVELQLDETLIMVELQRSRRVSAANLCADPRVQSLLRSAGGHFRIIESPWMPMDYRETIEQNEAYLINRDNLYLRHGCDSIFSTSVLTPDRNMGFCCGLGRELIPELSSPWQRGDLDGLLHAGARDFMKIWLYVDGPEKILGWAAEKDPRIQWENRYAHHCHACLALFADPLVRTAIREHYQERVADVLMRFVVRLRTQQATGHDFSSLR